MNAKLELNFNDALGKEELRELAEVCTAERRSIESVAYEAIREWARRRRDAREAAAAKAA